MHLSETIAPYIKRFKVGDEVVLVGGLIGGERYHHKLENGLEDWYQFNNYMKFDGFGTIKEYNVHHNAHLVEVQPVEVHSVEPTILGQGTRRFWYLDSWLALYNDPNEVV